MGNSLQEQLLKAGLVDPQKLKEARAEKRKQTRQPGGRDSERERAVAQQAQARKAERDRELNRQRQEEARRKAIAAEVRDLVQAHRVPRDGGDVAFHFIDGKLVRRIYVTAEQQRQLAAGQLAVVRPPARYELVPLEIAEKIRARDPTAGVFLSAQSPADAEDDAYAAYKVPDDLMW